MTEGSGVFVDGMSVVGTEVDIRVIRAVGDCWGSRTNVSEDTIIEFGLSVAFVPEQATEIVTSIIMSNNNMSAGRFVVNRRVGSKKNVLCRLNTIEIVVQWVIIGLTTLSSQSGVADVANQSAASSGESNS